MSDLFCTILFDVLRIALEVNETPNFRSLYSTRSLRNVSYRAHIFCVNSRKVIVSRAYTVQQNDQLPVQDTVCHIYSVLL